MKVEVEGAGPLVRRLRSFGELQGLVAGPWGDLIAHFHQLLALFAESRAAKQARATGGQASAGMLGKLTGEVRRSFSVEVVRLQATCLLERLAYLDPGVRAAGERSRTALRGEERRRKEAEAYRMAHGPGAGLGRVGRVFIP